MRHLPNHDAKPSTGCENFAISHHWPNAIRLNSHHMRKRDHLGPLVVGSENADYGPMIHRHAENAAAQAAAIMPSTFAVTSAIRERSGAEDDAHDE